MKTRAITMDVTAVKAAFGGIADKVQSTDIGMKKRGRIQAYVISPERYALLNRLEQADVDQLQKLSAEYAVQFERMQTEVHRSAAHELMTLDPDVLTARLKKSAVKPAPMRSVRSPKSRVAA